MTKVFASIGECMIELSDAGGGLYRRGFAGDTLNTAWGVRGLTDPAQVLVRYVTRVGDDAASEEMLGFFSRAGIDASHVSRVPGRPVGLYMIALQGFERSFTYWRDSSAARLLAADLGALRAALADADCVYLSGITLAILPPEHRGNLFAALAEARARGAMIAFDANVRVRLWPSLDALRAGLEAGYRAATIALPTFPDEGEIFGDASAEETVVRIAGYGVPEIVVKDGAEPCTLQAEGRIDVIPAVPVAEPLDTTGAGDSFNAGYLAARLAGRSPAEAVRLAHKVAARVICSRGALIDMAALREITQAEPA
ncbi:2-dehydro-3-deoxygluconokinase [Ancylobacter sp. 3268]|uniref:sugar kinase n=1 Tax=Ancylobacter sp. 3268 TaxID=2817752 RepID=UPI002856B58D|nr:sugar kinase [Ancylobacter sp. 3268]MDR6950882.1 2-dehydro-3-deoxygluconokinase [Ancylobacter sp. 3268]